MSGSAGGDQMKRILIVDDHSIVGAGLQQFLAASDGFEVAGLARSGQEGLSRVAEEPWDLVLLDIGLPDINGIEVLKRIRRGHPDLPVLIFSQLEPGIAKPLHGLLISQGCAILWQYFE